MSDKFSSTADGQVKLAQSDQLQSPDIDDASVSASRLGLLSTMGLLTKIATGRIEAIEEVFIRHGDIITISLKAGQILLLGHPAHARYILQENSQNYVKEGIFWDTVRFFLGNGLPVGQPRSFWRRQRRMIQPQLHRKDLAKLLELMIASIEDSLNSWEEYADSKCSFDINEGFADLAMDVVVKTLFGTSVTESESQEIRRAVHVALDSIFWDMSLSSLPRWLPIRSQRRTREALVSCHHVVSSIINRQSTAGRDDNTLLSMLLNVRDEDGTGMNEEQLRDEVFALLGGGYETISTGLSWAVHLLLHSPEQTQKLRREAQKVFCHGRPAPEDVPALKRSRWIFQEALRLYPPGWFLYRQAVQDDHIGDVPVQSGTIVIPVIYRMHHRADIWPRPQDFVPDRFDPTHAFACNVKNWMPFGGGERICIGSEFAMTEAALVLAMLYQRYKISPAPGYRIRPHASTTIRPKYGVAVQLRRCAGQ